MSQFSSFRIFRVTLACAVALWLAGTGCLLGCKNGLAAASTHDQPAESQALVISGAACAGHSGSTKHGSKSPSSESTKTLGTTTRSIAGAQTLARRASPSSMMDCPLAVNSAAALSKAGPDTPKVSPALTNLNEPPLNRLEQRAALARPLRLPNRGHTYLRCCVFLI